MASSAREQDLGSGYPNRAIAKRVSPHTARHWERSSDGTIQFCRSRPLWTQAPPLGFFFSAPPPLVLSKYFATEAAFENAHEAMRIHGGYGYSKEFAVERLYRDAPLLCIGEGTNEMQRMIFAKQVMEEQGMKTRFALPLLAMLLPFAAAAQTFPSKPVRIVVPYTPGGGTDIISRHLAQTMQESWGQQVIVENRPGANGIIGTEVAVKSPPDGHTVAMVVGAHVVNAVLQAKMPFDPINDTAAVSLVATSPWVIGIYPGVPAQNLREFIAYAKANPGKLRFGSSESSSRLAGEQFKQAADVDLVHVPYKGGGQIVQDMLGGHVETGFTSVLTYLPHYKSGRLRILAVAGSRARPRCPTCRPRRRRGCRVTRLTSGTACTRQARHRPSFRASTRRSRASSAAGNRERLDAARGRPGCQHARRVRRLYPRRAREVREDREAGGHPTGVATGLHDLRQCFPA